MIEEPFWIEVKESDLRQGDYLPNCLVPVAIFDPEIFSRGQEGAELEVEVRETDLIILTQSCDLENGKADFVALCPIYPIVEFEKVNPQFAKKKDDGMRCVREESRVYISSHHQLILPTIEKHL
jgi:hypothetical protein